MHCETQRIIHLLWDLKEGSGYSNKEESGSKERFKAESTQPEDKGRKIYDEPVGPSIMPDMQGEEKTEKPSEEKGFFGRETEKYFSRKKVGEIIFGSTLILEVPKAAGGWILHMGGVGVKKLSDNFPEGSKVVDTLLEYVNKPVDFLIENMGKGYSWSKGNIIFLSGKVFGSEGGTKVAEGIGGVEREVGDIAAKFEPTEEQGYVLKFFEVIGLGKLFTSLTKHSVSKLVKDTKIDGKADVHVDTAGKAKVEGSDISEKVKLEREGVKQPIYSNDPYMEAIKEGGVHHGQYKRFMEQDINQLKKSIKSFDKNVAKHEEYIQNPKSHVPDWDLLDIEHKENKIKHWNNDIVRAKEFKYIAEKILESKFNKN
ncbi:hypothetical protein NF27_GC00030 [Candidatus Jidaibacter acanthamoeba]|uniref:Uncharacterized protein n=1 Tax=Candidatus Jidaibacter acanthamoebae TaxID=86105 RepID=A0A0C1QGM3_9RICK|nr:hypothetical protein [Candidatus Jidaibacter acanthamoeba]KIE04724.1 hypothetical protein NF27_GC00030 [Candidatus Jidaibacter acanthamoeba]